MNHKPSSAAVLAWICFLSQHGPLVTELMLRSVADIPSHFTTLTRHMTAVLEGDEQNDRFVRARRAHHGIDPKLSGAVFHTFALAATHEMSLRGFELDDTSVVPLSRAVVELAKKHAMQPPPGNLLKWSDDGRATLERLGYERKLTTEVGVGLVANWLKAKGTRQALRSRDLQQTKRETRLILEEVISTASSSNQKFYVVVTQCVDMLS